MPRQVAKSGVAFTSPTCCGSVAGSTGANSPERFRLARTISAISLPKLGSDEAKSGTAIGSGVKSPPVIVMLTSAFAASEPSARIEAPARPSLIKWRRVIACIVVSFRFLGRLLWALRVSRQLARIECSLHFLADGHRVRAATHHRALRRRRHSPIERRLTGTGDIGHADDIAGVVETEMQLRCGARLRGARRHIHAAMDLRDQPVDLRLAERRRFARILAQRRLAAIAGNGA